MAGRKNFVAGEILTAADVNSFLMDQSVMVFDDSAARGSAIPTPSEGMVTYRKDDSRLEVFDGSSFGPVGTILQVASTSVTSALSSSIAARAFWDFGLSASITPVSATSQILVRFEVTGTSRANDTVNFLPIRIVRGSTPVGVGDVAGDRSLVTSSVKQFISGNQVGSVVNVSGAFLDSPNTTSATSYKAEFLNTSSNTEILYINRGHTDTNDIGFERTISTITLMEVAG